MGTTEAEQIMTRFVASWEGADVDELLAYFSEDAVWRPGPMKPAIGKPALRDAISTWFASTTQLGAEIHTQVSDGRMVMHERTDRYMLGNQEMATAVGAAFEIEDRLITAWREYFDMPPEFRSWSSERAADATAEPRQICREALDRQRVIGHAACELRCTRQYVRPCQLTGGTSGYLRAPSSKADKTVGVDQRPGTGLVEVQRTGTSGRTSGREAHRGEHDEQ